MTAPDGEARLDATVRGGVQGVGYRFFVLRVAARLAVTGWVANEPDGSVRCVAEGTRTELERLLAALRDGPPAARVDDVAVTWSAASGGFTSFGVRARGHSGD
ncbi:MAG TPA: acylphosphatase [Candidatus Limnocylindrales bacterium]